ncbi:MAG: hypothetical protein JO202_14925 [Ktedonobacteraceae bacterium]|nr:hypothetical protein [Ktedonobacteraceae bacterium]
MPMHPDHSDIPTADDAPWMPLEGLIEQWAELAQEATTPFLSKAVSAAFAAFSYEQEALASYQLARTEHPLGTTAYWPSALETYEPTLDDLDRASKEWTATAYALRSAAFGRDGVCLHRLRGLVTDALTERQRVCRIAHVVRAEQQARYHQQKQQYQEARP